MNTNNGMTRRWPILPDTIVPAAGNALDYHRYAYAAVQPGEVIPTRLALHPTRRC